MLLLSAKSAHASVRLYTRICHSVCVVSFVMRRGKQVKRKADEEGREANVIEVRDDARPYCTSPVGTAQTDVVLAGARELEYGTGLAKNSCCNTAFALKELEDFNNCFGNRIHALSC